MSEEASLEGTPTGDLPPSELPRNPAFAAAVAAKAAIERDSRSRRN